MTMCGLVNRCEVPSLHCTGSISSDGSSCLDWWCPNCGGRWHTSSMAGTMPVINLTGRISGEVTPQAKED